MKRRRDAGRTTVKLEQLDNPNCPARAFIGFSTKHATILLATTFLYGMPPVAPHVAHAQDSEAALSAPAPVVESPLVRERWISPPPGRTVRSDQGRRGATTGQAAAPANVELAPILVEGDRAGPDNSIVARWTRSGSKTNTPLREIPQAVSVITRDEMNARGANTVGEALRYTPGVMTEINGNDVRYDWAWIRGYNTYGRRWLDGLALPGDPDGYAAPSINPYSLERVEVIKGPASVLYGQTLPGGLLNQVSKRPQATARNEVDIMTSSRGGVQTSFDSTGPLTKNGELTYRLVGQVRDLGSQIDKERDRQVMLAPSFTWSPNVDTSVTVYSYYQKLKPDNFSPRFYPAVGTLIINPYGQIPTSTNLGGYGSNANTFEMEFFALGYEFAHRVNETWSVRQNARFGAADQNMFLAMVNPAFAYSSAGTTVNRVVAASDDSLASFDIDNQVEARFNTGPLSHTALLGLEYIRATSDRKFGQTAIAPLNYLNPVYGGTYPFPAWTTSVYSKQDQVGLYVQDQIRLDRWMATLGLRCDDAEATTTNRLNNTTADNQDKVLTGRAGLAYLFENGLTPYVSYSTAFLPVLGTDVYGNPYKAQKSAQYEAGIKFEPAGARGMVGISVFDLTLENALTPFYSATGSMLGYVQTGKQRIRGLEIEGKYELTQEVDLVASYAYSQSKVLETNIRAQRGKEMLRVPTHQAGLWVRYRPERVRGLGLSAGIRATSSYHSDTTYLPSLEIPGCALVDVGAEYDFGALRNEFRGASFRVNVSNLFDEIYVTHCINATGGSCNVTVRSGARGSAVSLMLRDDLLQILNAAVGEGDGLVVAGAARVRRLERRALRHASSTAGARPGRCSCDRLCEPARQRATPAGRRH